jgi:hypothetical protein
MKPPNVSLQALLTPARIRLVVGVLGAILVLAVIAGVLTPRFAASRIRAVARGRGMAASWRDLRTFGFTRARVTGLVLRRATGGDTLLAADSLEVRLRFAPLLLGRARTAEAELFRARVELPPAAEAELDTLAPDDDSRRGAVAAAVRQRAQALVRTLLAPARNLPEVHLRDVSVMRSGEPQLDLAALDLSREAKSKAVNLAAAGTLRGADRVPFDVLLRWDADDRLAARAEFRTGPAAPPSPGSLVLLLDGHVTQDRKARELRIADGTVLKVGDLAAGVVGRVSATGPRFELAIAADHLTADGLRRSLPAPMLGPLAGLDVRGSFDWRFSADLDLARPDSVRFHADVIPHGLVLDPRTSQPSLAALAGPFTARIHLPKGRIVTRELSPANPHYRPLDRISPFLRDAVLTNEDGAFWWHRGFNTEAIGLAVAANLRAGAYKRGAGTITMQLARNLWLGHERTLSRKAQEVVFAWLLEHASGLTKERLLEIYLNIIEWGPDVHGADEAARWYFDEDAAKVSLPEALFLATLLPSPSRWSGRFTSDGALRPFVKAQMHFIAAKMATKGWLDPAEVAGADSLAITLRGPAASRFAPPDTAATAADSTVSAR